MRTFHKSIDCFADCTVPGTSQAARHPDLPRAQLDVPYLSEVVPLDLVVVGQQHDSLHDSLGDCLTDQKPVEGILVKLWERRDPG